MREAGGGGGRGVQMNKGGSWCEWQNHISLDREIVVLNPGPNRHHGPSMGRERKRQKERDADRQKD